jgi:hypothetical protein
MRGTDVSSKAGSPRSAAALAVVAAAGWQARNCLLQEVLHAGGRLRLLPAEVCTWCRSELGQGLMMERGR